jgi:hypothetical protein
MGKTKTESDIHTSETALVGGYTKPIGEIA